MELSETVFDALVLAVLWTGYFAVHSLLASLKVKQWAAAHLPGGMTYYRLGFNILAVVLLLVPLAYLYFNQTDYLWQWQGIAAWIADGLAVLALLLFGWTLLHYDMQEFLGLRQIRENAHGIEDQENLKIGTLHRFVRHPWYTLGLIVLWTRSMDVMFLTSAVVITLYLKIGSLLEERKLIEYHGQAYRKYRRRVPGIVPRPWRFLRKREAEALTASTPR